jgi:two-component system, chemotaxis family, response regulator WspF
MRIAIVNDLKLACEALRRAVVVGGRHQVAWTATGGSEAIMLASRDRPDLILMDMIMPGIDGAEATRQIMLQSPCPILVVTSTVSGNISKVFDALSNGALDAVETPTLGPQGELLGSSPLMEKIARLEHLHDRPPVATGRTPTAGSAQVASAQPASRLVLIGASTGGPKVLAEILNKLPSDLAAPILIAQHIDEGYVTGLAKWLGDHTSLPVEVAVAGSEPRSGHVYLAASQKHLAVRSDGRLEYVNEPGSSWYHPSVDVLFSTAARHMPVPGIAALLTGMGRDGANGLVDLRRAGWTTIAQDQATSIVWGMPKAAFDLGAAEFVLPSSLIAAHILSDLKRVRIRPASNR